MMERRLSFQNRIVLVYSALLVVVLSLYGVITGMVVLRSQKNQIIDQYRELGRKTVQQLDTFFRDMDHLALQVIYSARIKQILLQIESEEEQNFFTDRYSLGVEFRDILAAFSPLRRSTAYHGETLEADSSPLPRPGVASGG